MIPATQAGGQCIWFQRIKQEGFSHRFHKHICFF
ncbi:hypothetical protein DBR06_SOUSAS1710077 [Sousa chinensis]|uniref:Uncharacterized protein n=1 Tax=Sousa chinensis TaxID=103600 RepID=A0A484GTW6_SOUCH|nr:hypothetical protein DBR06_SOUSAS1710077 [Sousa chinensis]